MTPEDRPPAPQPEPRGRGLRAWVERTRRYAWPRFLFEATLIALLLRIPVVWIGAPIVGSETRTAYDWLTEYSALELLLIAVVIGPIIETVVAQWLPIAATRRLFQSDAYAVTLSAWLFGWLHYTQGAMLVLIMFTTGLVLAWTFVVWRDRRGAAAAFAMTAGVHALLNGVALGAAFLVPQATPTA